MRTRLIITILLFLVGKMLTSAENYPYRSDYLWVTVPDHADWIYKTGENAKVEVQFYKYGIPRDGELEYSIGTDLLPPSTWAPAARLVSATSGSP